MRHVGYNCICWVFSVCVVASLPAQVENAADNYLAASAMYKKVPDSEEDATSVIEKGWVGDHLAIEEGLAENADAFAELRDGIRKPYCSLPPVEGFDTPLPYLSQMRGMARLLLAEGRFFESRGDCQKAYQSFTGVVKMGSDLAKNGALVHFLVGTSIENIALKVIRDSLKNPAADPGVYAAAARRLEDLDKSEASLADILAREFEMCERALIREAAKVYSSVGQRTALEAIVFPPVSPLWPLVVGWVGGVKQWAASSDGFGPGIAVWLLCPHATRCIREYGQRAVARAKKPYAEAINIHLPMPGDPIARMLIPAIERAAIVYAAAATQRSATRAMLSLVAHKRLRGRYPDRLESIVSADGPLTQMPLDGFTGKPLKYRMSGEGCLIYSLGPDSADDGGLAECSDPLDAESRGDIVFRLER